MLNVLKLNVLKLKLMKFKLLKLSLLRRHFPKEKCNRNAAMQKLIIAKHMQQKCKTCKRKEKATQREIYAKAKKCKSKAKCNTNANECKRDVKEKQQLRNANEIQHAKAKTYKPKCVESLS